jgi:N-acetylmuramoyl-L-alanine amidase
MDFLKKYILMLAAFLVFQLSLPFIAQASPLVYETERLAGQDRIETALRIAQKGWSTAETVMLCEYADYADSIAASPFAALLDAPILLTEGKTLDPRVAEEMKRLNVKNVVLLGGTGCLQPSIEEDLNAQSWRWERIGGADRYETSVLLAKKIGGDAIILANGDDFPDALSAASFAGIRRIPIILTSKVMPPSVAEYCRDTQPQHIIVIGGEGVVPTEELASHQLTIETRLGGRDRFETNAKVVAHMSGVVESNDLFIASGMSFPDAVAGASLTSKLKAPLLLTEKEDIPAEIYGILREHMKVEPPQVIPVTNENKSGKITASGGLLLRDAASRDGKALLTVPEGTSIEIAAAQGEWYQTSYQGKTGWVSASYVTITYEYKQGRVTAAGGLNLRETPEANGKVLLMIPAGAAITVTDQRDSWYQTVYQEKTGWVHADYVTLPPTAPSADSAAADSGQTVVFASEIDLSPNGKVYFLGGSGVIELTTQSIVEGKTASKYADNLKAFPPLPSVLAPPVVEPEPGVENPAPGGYDPSQEIALDPFQGIPDYALALAGKTILVDPGHGGPDPGTIGVNHTYEKTNTLAISLYLNEILTQAGATVILTRDSDVSVAAEYSESADLRARADIASQYQPDLFISVHNDWNDNLSIQGTTVYYSLKNPQAAESNRLAGMVLNSMTGELKTTSKNVRTANYYVLSYVDMPAILIEAAYMSNAYEEARLQNPVFRQNVAAAIFRGIYNYYANSTP